MSLVGNLEDLSLPDILQIVSLSKKSGILMLEREGMQGKIIIRQGRVIQTVTPRRGKTLGEILTTRGLISPEDQKRVIEAQAAGGGKELFGIILVRMKLISLETLEKVVQEQIEEAICFFLSWKEGTFNFELADIQGRGEFSVDPQAFILERGIDTQWLVLEGTRLIDERSRGGSAPVDAAPATGPEETSFADIDAAAEERALVLIDDDAVFREIAREHYGRAGLRVVPCEGVVEGLKAVAEEARRPGPPPVVISDVVMPTSDNRGFLGGLELIEKLSTIHPGIPVAVVTAYPDENVKEKVLSFGGKFFLKPGGDAGAGGITAFLDQVVAVLLEAVPTGLDVVPAPIAAKPAAAAPATAPASTPPAAVAAPAPVAGGGDPIAAALDAVRAALERQEKAVASAGLGSEEAALLRDMLGELQNPRATSEIGLLILRFAAELMNRAVLFVVKGGKAVGLGGFGVEAGGASKGIRGIALPLDEPSLLAEVVRRRSLVHGSPEAAPVNRSLFDQLGGKTPAEAVAVPLLSGGRVRVILYGDNLPEAKPLAGLRALELFLAQAGLTLEKVLLEKKLQEARAAGGGAGARPAQRVGGGVR